MCGIIGYKGTRDAYSIIIEGLKRLEYRGYDSAGIAICMEDGDVWICKKKGKIDSLTQNLNPLPSGRMGIGHTRWATHGPPSDENAHPHRSESVIVVHNGIIENYSTLKRILQRKGKGFTSDTDSEVIAHLIDVEIKSGKSLKRAVLNALRRLKGSYAVLLMFKDHPEILVGARNGSPLVLGMKKNEFFFASDIPALAPLVDRVIYMKDGEVAWVEGDELRFCDINGNTLYKEVKEVSLTPSTIDKGGFKHFMVKEINEQPESVWNTFLSLTEGIESNVLDEVAEEIAEADCIYLSACGTSFHASMIGAVWFEEIAGIPSFPLLASEERHRSVRFGGKVPLIAISQSGETADTLFAVRKWKGSPNRCIAICNVPESTLTNECDWTLHTRAGPEISVASTKAFTSQLTTLLLLALKTSSIKKHISRKEYNEFILDFRNIPSAMNKALIAEKRIVSLAKKYHNYHNFLYLGRWLSYPIALEGALKLKEISYIHAEGYASGEMKHGPIALIDRNMPVVFVAPADRTHTKSRGNMEEVKAREGQIIIITDSPKTFRGLYDDLIKVESVPEIFTPFLTIIPLQLIAYYIALIKGTDIDQPRNLAKSVTVE